MVVKGVAKVHLESGPNMTPLVDVVMVILIFLMLAGGFGGVEHYLSSTLPTKDFGHGPQPPHPLNDAQLDLRVDSGLDPGALNIWTIHVGNMTTTSVSELKAGLINHRLKYSNNNTPVDKIQVIINPNQFVKWESLVNIYQTVLEAGYTRIAFSQAH